MIKKELIEQEKSIIVKAIEKQMEIFKKNYVITYDKEKQEIKVKILGDGEVEEVIEITEGGKEETGNSFLEVEVKDGKVSIGVDFYTDEGTEVEGYEIENNLKLIQKFIYGLNSETPNEETVEIINKAFADERVRRMGGR